MILHRRGGGAQSVVLNERPLPMKTSCPDCLVRSVFFREGCCSLRPIQGRLARSMFQQRLGGDLAAAGVLVLDELVGMAALLQGLFAEEFGEAVEAHGVAVEVGEERVVRIARRVFHCEEPRSGQRSRDRSVRPDAAESGPCRPCSGGGARASSDTNGPSR